MCHCPSDGEYNKIRHQTIKIQFSTGQRGSLEVRKQGEVTMKPGTQGAGRVGVSMGVLSHRTLGSRGMGKQSASEQEMPAGRSKQAAGRNFPGSHTWPPWVHPTDLPALVKAATPPALRLSAVSLGKGEIRREREGAPAPFSRTGQLSGSIFQRAHNLATWVGKCWSQHPKYINPRLKATHPANWWITSVKMATLIHTHSKPLLSNKNSLFFLQINKDASF